MNNKKPVYSTNKIEKRLIVEQNKTINQKIRENDKIQQSKYKCDKGYYAYFN